jgi:hypothetical protein
MRQEREIIECKGNQSYVRLDEFFCCLAKNRIALNWKLKKAEDVDVSQSTFVQKSHPSYKSETHDHHNRSIRCTIEGMVPILFLDETACTFEM